MLAALDPIDQAKCTNATDRADTDNYLMSNSIFDEKSIANDGSGAPRPRGSAPRASNYGHYSNH